MCRPAKSRRIGTPDRSGMCGSCLRCRSCGSAGASGSMHGGSRSHGSDPGWLRRRSVVATIPGMPSSPDPSGHSTLEHAFRCCLRGDAATLAAQAELGVLVAMFDLEDWQPYLARAAELIDVHEAARAARQRLPRNRDMLLLAYALHRLLLSQVLGCAIGDVPLGRDAKGCPRLHGDRLFTSLSHAGQRVAIAIAGAGPVGIDVEPISRATDMPELAERVAHPDELRELASLGAHALGEALLAMWVRKEALLK